ncbi:unnamed protein product [Linum tenue]|uniref:Uncharacterized protein n=1 Tax=Linum tenue TaxID=586396 RepID=A0AAV0RT06_9ROSI|nr:unnamed protein product [Linum tenue]
MATGGEKPENSGPATTSGGSAVGGDNLDQHNTHAKKREKTTPSSSSESSWGEPVESTASAKNTKSNPAADDGSPPTEKVLDDPDCYRIPSEVFSRTKSSTPMDWSVASNESLFSIQMGNMSFTKDHAFLLGKSDELGYDPAMSMGLSPMASPMRDRPPISSSPAKSSSNSGSPKPAETATPPPPSKDKKPDTGGGGTPSSVTQQEIKQNESGGGGGVEQQNPTQVAKDPSFHSASLRRSSTASGASVKSFAFPILTGDGQHRSTQSQSQPPTPQAAQQEPVTPRSDRDNVNNNNSKSSQPSTPKSGENKGNQGGGAAGGQGSKWFSCFPCCPSRTS